MIRVLTNYYITIPFVAPLSSLTCTKVYINLYIWSGLKSAVPSVPTYEYEKENPTASSGSIEVDISRQISDFLDFDANFQTTTGAVSGNNQVWVRWETLYTTTDPADLTTPTNINTKLAVKGYSYGLDGKNSETPTNKILIPIIDYKVFENFVVPIEINEISSSTVNVVSYPANTLNQTINIPASTNSNNLIQNICISIPTAEEFIEVTYNSETITLLIESECRYNPIEILFQNKEGAIQVLPFFKKSVESMDITSEEFESDNGQPSDGHHQFTTYNIQARQKFNVNSGFVDESMNEVFKQLLLSQRIWRINGSELIPINIASKSFEYKNRVNDRLINYQINFEYAFNELNNI